MVKVSSSCFYFLTELLRTHEKFRRWYNYWNGEKLRVFVKMTVGVSTVQDAAQQSFKLMEEYKIFCLHFKSK